MVRARMISDRHRRLLFRLWVGAVFVVFFVACLHEAFGPFLFGHDGYNGAAFAQAARNSLRFGMLQQAQYYTGAAPPELAEVYTNHPIFLGLHLMTSFAIFGEHDWAGRLVPIIYSLLFLGLLYRVVARRWSPLHGAFAITLWVLTPLHLIFANMIDHEQGGMFWCLFLIDRYLTWRSARTWKNEALIALGVTMAMQFDWPGYYFAFFIGLHSTAMSFVASDAPTPAPWWRRIGFTVRFSMVVLANAAAFFGWVVSLRGSFKSMAESFSSRTGGFEGYGDLLVHRLVDLYGVGLLTLLGLWLVWSLVRLARGRASHVDLIPWSFAVTQLIHSYVFRSAGAIHSYWTFWIGPALAIGGAQLIVAARDLVRRIAWKPHIDRALRIGALALLLVAAGMQTSYALMRHRWGYDRGRASYVEGAPDEWIDVQFAQAMYERFGREGTTYDVHRSFDRRVHVLFYLDAPRDQRWDLRAHNNEIGLKDSRRHVFLADTWGLSPKEGATLRTLASEYDTYVYERRFVAIDFSRPAKSGPVSFEAFYYLPESPSVFWRWLVSFRNPPGAWVPDPDREWLAHGGLAASGIIEDDRWAGGRGGFRDQTRRCPPGYLVSKLAIRSDTDRVASVSLTCKSAEWLHGDNERTYVDETKAGGVLGAFVEKQPNVDVECAPESVFTGLHGRSGAVIDALGGLCSKVTFESSGPSDALLGKKKITNLGGGHGGDLFRLECPDGMVLVGLDGKSGALVDGLMPLCSPISLL